MKIIVTSGAWQGSLACMQSFGRAGHEVFLIDQDPHCPVAHSKYCFKHIISPSEKDEAAYTAFLLNLIQKENFDLLMPVSDHCVQYCAKNLETIQKYTLLVTPPKDTVLLAANKSKTYLFALDHNIPIPKTYFPPDLPEVLRLSEKNIYPCVVKIPNSHASQGVYYAQNKQELIRLFNSQLFEEQWPVIQEFIPGDMYGLTAVAREGKILGYFMFVTTAQFSKGGTPPVAFSVTDPELRAVAQKLIAALNWTGAIDLDYFYVPGRGYVLLEINPRFSGTINFAYRMGVDLPQMYLTLAVKGAETDFYQAPYKEKVMFRTVFPTEIIWCYKRPKYKWTFLKNFLRLAVKTNIYWDDPRLLWWQIKESRWLSRDIQQAQPKAETTERNLTTIA